MIDAIARRDQIRVLVDGMTAANDLGLTNAVPSKIVVHTDARVCSMQLGNMIITFKPTAASKLYWAGRPGTRFTVNRAAAGTCLPLDEMQWLRHY